MQPYTFTITFSGAGSQQVSLPSTVSPNACAQLIVQPANGNSHVCYVGTVTMNIGVSTTANVIYQLAAPAGVASTPLDVFRIDAHMTNTIALQDLSFDGTSGEAVKITALVV